MRGLAALIMLQGHVMDGWVRPQDRSGEWFWLSQFMGGLPAPIFLFLVGVSLAIVLDRMRARGAPALDLIRKVVRRGVWILFLAYVFRLEQFLIWYPASEWTGVFRVDTLNCIAVCTMLVGILSAGFKSRRGNIVAMAITTAGFVVATPLIYPFRGLPGFVLSYVNGNDHPSYFSFFPWAAFTLAGITFGYILIEAKQRIGEPEFFKRVAVFAICAYAAGRAMSLTSMFEYGFFDYSLTSPHYFLVRLGWVLLILYGAYLWSRHELAAGWSPLISLGQASLIVYWLHVDIVYGRLFHGFAQTLEFSGAMLHLMWLAPLMLVAATVRPALVHASHYFTMMRSSITGNMTRRALM
jgi:uncharacterized membrane protein